MLYQITFGESIIQFSLEYKARKSLGIQVHPDYSVKVIAPLETDLETIKKRLKTKAAWIIKQQDYFLSFHPFTPTRQYVSGETHLYLGRQYRLKIIESVDKKVLLKQGYIQIFTPTKVDKTVIEQQLKNWYTERAKYHFPILIDKLFPKFKMYHIAFPRFEIRWMTKRWGSCTPSKKILLNTELIKASKADIEYVILHELCHLIHPNHSQAYFKLLDKMLPNWRKYKVHLEQLMA